MTSPHNPFQITPQADASAQVAHPTGLSPAAIETMAIAAGQSAEQLQLVCHSMASNGGWWRDPETGQDILEAAGRWAPFVIATKIALIHSETSEALEGHRTTAMDDKLKKRPAVEVELADTVIRIFDLSGRMKLDVAGAIRDKLIFNQTRKDHRPEERAKTGGKLY